MRLVTATLVLSVLSVLGAGSGTNHSEAGTRYGFYRTLMPDGSGSGAGGGGGAGTRRVFGGAPATLATFPAACALLDRYWAARCSCAVLTEHWALTAGHCVAAHVAYVSYNRRRVTPDGAGAAPVLYLYQHPGYEVKLEKSSGGSDVTSLQHDVGLVRARGRLALATRALDAVHGMRAHRPHDLVGEEVEVLGFGRTEGSAPGSELWSVRLRLAACGRPGWLHCLCAVGLHGQAGVCAGDSGGPVLYHGAQVGVTSMGPVECSRAVPPPAQATSVITALYEYADVINATIHNTDNALHLRMIGAAPPRHAGVTLVALAVLLVLLVPARAT